MNRSIAVALVVLSIFFSQEAGAAPNYINYQGMLADPSGNALDGTKAIQFSIYAVHEGGTAVWGPQTFSAVLLTDGRFNVILGPSDSSSRPIANAFVTDSAYLAIKVADSEAGLASASEISPRQQILSTPYALQAANGVPVGGIIPFHSFDGTLATPTGWEVCDGRVISDSSSLLNGQNTPDLTNRFLMGGTESGTSGGHDILSIAGSTGSRDGGADLNGHKHELPIGNYAYTDGSFGGYGGFSIPNPNQSWAFGIGGSHSVVYSGSDMGMFSREIGSITAPLSNTPYATDLNSHTHSQSISGSAGSNIPPYYTVIYIIRIK